MPDAIQLLQFLICKEFRQARQDGYTAEMVHSNLFALQFPFTFEKTYAVTCWRKDKRFHKEVIEFSTEDGPSLRTEPMDIEPVTNTVLFRWHKHPFPADLVIEKPTLLTLRVVLDWKICFESYVMIEKG